MRKLRITLKAKRDLKNIGRYTEQRYGVVQRKKYLKEIIERFDSLLEDPLHGKKREDIKEGYYSYPQGKHLVFYMFNENSMEIISVLHESMDFKRHL